MLKTDAWLFDNSMIPMLYAEKVFPFNGLQKWLSNLSTIYVYSNPGNRDGCVILGVFKNAILGTQMIYMHNPVVFQISKVLKHP